MPPTGKDILSFQNILCKPYRWLFVKIPVEQQFLKYSYQPVCHQQPCHIQKSLKSPFFLILMLSFELHQIILMLDHVYIPKCIELLPYDWLIRYLH